ncbi:MAG: isoleucine--tRNA ligase [Candidatus Levyibacteriota bacterium]
MKKDSKKPYFKPVSPQIQFPEMESEVSKYWKENQIFEKSVESRPADKRWTFLDGPPFVTGVPHYGSLLSSLPKDLFGRYWTMKGYRVRRVWGWDGHGLPIENKVETKLAIERKKDIEDVVGVGKFIEECKKYVNDVSAEWEWYVDRIGRWVDFKHAYKTWDINYMESVMWVFKQMYEKGNIYKGLRVTLYCPHCATPISNFEIAMDNSYKEIQDAATTYKYQLKDEKDTYILAWSTTPWNKIVTPALAVNPELDYVKVWQNDQYYILAKTTLKTLGDEKTYKILEEFKGKDLVGKEFIPHYDYYKDKIETGKKAFVIIPGDFVTAEEGTGVVTIAAYGVEDLTAMNEQNIHIEIHVDEEGTIMPDVPKFGGMYYLKANKAVNEDLEERGLIYKDEMVPHNVPVCWRCGTRLYYAPLNAWFVDVQSLKEKLKKTNEQVNWFPEHFKHGRFLKSLESAPDWNISRNRYWGSPVPVWECECGERFVPGSIKELEEASGEKITDLHKPLIDEVTVTCKKCGEKAHRVPEVLDSWIEAGSASFAERHFPFNTEEKLEDFFPPDFIAEYTGQIRAWFYVLHVIGAALYDSVAFKNVVVEGVILGTDGRKMSKNYGNYPDPKLLLETYGGDALRLYLMGSPVMHGEDILISEDNYKMQVRGMLLILWNVYNFFVTYADLDGWSPDRYKSSTNTLDKWIISRMNGNIENIKERGYEKYDTVEIVGQAQIFVQDLSLWYLRRSRDRMSPTYDDEQDKNNAFSTLWYVLKEYSKALAPLIPFITEEIYRNLTKEISVHLADWPESNKEYVDKQLEVDMDNAMKIASVIHMMRKNEGVSVKIPLKSFKYHGPKISNEVKKILLEEVNVYELELEEESDEIYFKGNFDDSNQDKAAGEAREIIRKIQAERKNIGTTLSEMVNVTLPSWPEKFEEEIKKKTLIKSLSKGDFSVSKI